VCFAEREFLDKIENKEEKNIDKDRMVGIFYGEVEVERLDTDTDDFYEGYVAGAEAAYEVYLKKPAYNCPTGVFSSCDRAIPCDKCEFNDGFKRELSEDFCRGYDEGYTTCSVKWSSLIPKSLRNAEEDDDNNIYDGCVLNSKYEKGYRKGYNQGFEDGFNDGMGEVLVLDEDVLDAIYEIREQIKEVQRVGQGLENSDAVTSRMVVELYGVQGKLTDLAQMLVMDNVFKYWHKRQIEEDR